MFIKLAVRIIVSGWFLMCHTERTKQTIVTVYLPIKSHFGIEEVESFIDVEALRFNGFLNICIISCPPLFVNRKMHFSLIFHSFFRNPPTPLANLLKVWYTKDKYDINE